MKSEDRQAVDTPMWYNYPMPPNRTRSSASSGSCAGLEGRVYPDLQAK